MNLKETLEYIVGLRKPEIRDIDVIGANGIPVSQTYSDKHLEHLRPYNPHAKEIELHTLSSLVEYIHHQKDLTEYTDFAVPVFVHVQSPTKVALYSSLDADRERECVAVVTASLPSFHYGKFIDHEEFLIAVQANFVSNDDRELILKFAGTVQDKSVATYKDDGVTQKATIKQGLASEVDAIVPNPVSLIPFRTFVEVRQPESDFVFRMRNDGCKGVECALFEADGGAWELDAMETVKEYLMEKLIDMPNFIVIS